MIGGTKFYERAEIKDAVAYLQLLANPADGVSFARIVNSPRRRDRPADPGADLFAREHPRRRRLGGAREPPRHPRARLGGVEGGRPLRRRDGGPARARRAQRTGGRAAGGGPARHRLPRGAGGRAHGRGRGPGREPRGAGRRRGRVRRQPRAGRGAGGAAAMRAGGPPAGGVPGPDLADLRAGQPARGGEPRDPDVAAQRQGARVRRGLRDRLRGGRVPALALARGGQPGGGAPPLLRGRHQGPRAPLDDLRAAARAARVGELEPALALPRRAAGGAGGPPRRHRRPPAGRWVAAMPAARDRLRRATLGRLLGAAAEAAGAAAGALCGRRRRRPRELRRGGGDLGRGGLGGGRALRGRWRGAQADGGLCAA